MRRPLAALTFVAVALGTGAACSSSGDTSSRAAAPSTSTSPTSVPSPVTTEQALDPVSDAIQPDGSVPEPAGLSPSVPDDDRPLTSSWTGTSCLATSPPVRLVVAEGDVISRWAEGVLSPIATLDRPIVRAFMATGEAGPLVVAERVERRQQGRHDVVRVDGGAAIELPTSERGGFLYDLANVEGLMNVVFATVPGDDVEADPGELVLGALDGDGREPVAPGTTLTGAVTRASYGGGAVAVTLDRGVSEGVRFYGLDRGELTDRFDPTLAAGDSQAPLFTQAVLNPDGTELAWLEGPEEPPSGDDAAIQGEWILVVADAATGEERFRRPIGGASEVVDWLDFDGRWAVISWSDRSGARGEVRLADTDAGTDGALCGVAGVATFERAGS